MIDFFRTLFSADGFMPHGHCYLWRPGVLWLHITSDALIALAYYSIPFTLIYFIRHRRDLPFNWMFLCFATFIIACGTTHLMEIWVIWHPTYWLSGSIKALTALASVPTAVLLVRLMPQALALPSPGMLRAANAELTREIGERKRAEADALRLNDELERRVAERTQQLENANETLKQEIRERQRDAEKTKWLASFPERNPVPIVELDSVTGDVHYQNPTAVRLFPDLEKLRLEHPYVAGIHAAAAPLQNQGAQGARREVSVAGCHYAQTISYGLDHRRLRVYGSDITELKRAEEILRQSEERYRELFNTLIEGFCTVEVIFDPNGKPADFRFLEVNPAFEKQTGLQNAQGKSVRELALDLEPYWLETYAKVALTGELAHFENEARALGRYYDVCAHRVGGPESRKVAILFTDITGRKQMENALQEREKHFRTMANSISQLAWVARADGSIQWYNDRWYAYTGTAPRQMEGWGWQSVHDPERLPAVMAQWQEAITLGQPFEMEFPLRGADGHFRRFLTRALPFKNADGTVEQWFGTNTDVDELKRAEDEIKALNADLEERVAKRTAELEAANGELEAFSYSVSHDLRAPLRAINGFSSIVLEDFGPKLPAEARGYLERVCNGGKRMGELIDDLLEFSRLSRQPLNRQHVNMADLVQESLMELKPAGTNRQIETHIGEVPSCQGDTALLKQVWFNLLSNALKYSRNRAPAIIEVGCDKSNGQAVYFVRDNGAGFDMQYAQKLFGVFQRLHRADEFEGTGVGLAIVQRIIHRHGGQIWADAKPEHGATFYFSLAQEDV